MKLQDRLILMNDYRPFKSVFLNKITGNSSRFIVKYLASALLPNHFKHHPGIELYSKAQKEGRVSKAIVSMTSFPQRIDVVWLVVECLLRQTRVPQKVVIWLSSEQFPTLESVPETLRLYPEDVLEVRFVDGDIRSHKKYWYAVEEYKDKPLILVDDDLMFDSHIIEDLEDYSSLENKVIACSWGAKIKWDDEGQPLPYSQWGGEKHLYKITDDFFFGSGGGTYLPEGCLDGANQPIDDIMNICPMADDIWLNAITRRNGYRTCLVRDRISIPEWKIDNNIKLNTANNGQRQNDFQLKKVRDYMQKSFGKDPFVRG